MARPWRIEFAGALYHILAQGQTALPIPFNGCHFDFLRILNKLFEVVLNIGKI